MNELLASVSQLEELSRLFELQREAFRRHAPLPRGKRIEALDALLELVLKHQSAIVEAVSADFGGRSETETRMLEILPLADEIRHARNHLRRWMRTRSVPVNWQFLPSRARIHFQPLGVIGILGAWNYPLLLTLSPMVSALAAGNHVMLKPSEAAPCSARLLASMIAEVFPEEYVTVVEGGPELATGFSALPFDHLLFTGSSRVGKLVMKSAAENLTPVTLELGGKSPALVHDSFPMSLAADRICTAKFWNAGQTCVAPDYALIPAGQLDEFLRASESSIRRRFSHPEANPDYTRMISPAAWNRMRELVEDARTKGARILVIGETQMASGCAFPPTLIANATVSMRVMQEEIFGPVLPVVAYASFDQVLSEIESRPRPLALYYFDRNRARIRFVLDRTISGGVTINDCIFHLPQHNLPFGGVGPSGMGAYHGFDGFAAFSKKKGILLQSAIAGAVLDRFFKPPYTSFGQRLLSYLIGSAGKRVGRRITLQDDSPDSAHQHVNS